MLRFKQQASNHFDDCFPETVQLFLGKSVSLETFKFSIFGCKRYSDLEIFKISFTSQTAILVIV